MLGETSISGDANQLADPKPRRFQGSDTVPTRRAPSPERRAPPLKSANDPPVTTKAVGNGTGQGLWIAYRVVCQQHGSTPTTEPCAARHNRTQSNKRRHFAVTFNRLELTARARRALHWAVLVVPLALALLPSIDAAAQTAERAPATTGERRALLNSERIAQRFGSYGIAVLESDGRVRVSNLYSEEQGGRICRTFAVVKYPDAPDPALAAEHEEIVHGGSIGAVFAAHGWNVVKTNLRFLEVTASPRVAELMRVAAGSRLAAHAYVLDVSKAGRSIEYALLVEIHHPDYLKLGDLPAIYGTAEAAGREQSLGALLATAAERAAR